MIKNPVDENELPEREIEVTISLSVSKTVKIKVDDYTILDEGVDSEGLYYEDIDYSTCDLKSAVRNQISFPKDLTNWSIDEFEVIKE